MNRISILDLVENISALTIAILREDVLNSEDAFKILSGRELKKNSKETRDIVVAMTRKGMSGREVADTLGISRGTVYTYISKNKKEQMLSKKEMAN